MELHPPPQHRVIPPIREHTEHIVGAAANPYNQECPSTPNNGSIEYGIQTKNMFNEANIMPPNKLVTGLTYYSNAKYCISIFTI